MPLVPALPLMPALALAPLPLMPALPVALVPALPELRERDVELELVPDGDVPADVDGPNCVGLLLDMVALFNM